MDPQAAWLAMIQALIDEDYEVATEYADALCSWLERGGFPPRVLPDLGQTNDPQSFVNRLDRKIAFQVCNIVRNVS